MTKAFTLPIILTFCITANASDDFKYAVDPKLSQKENELLVSSIERNAEEMHFFEAAIYSDPFLVRYPSQVIGKQIKSGSATFTSDLEGATIRADLKLLNAYTRESSPNSPSKFDYDRLPIGLKSALRIASKGGIWMFYLPSHSMQLKQDIDAIKRDEPTQIFVEIKTVTPASS